MSRGIDLEVNVVEQHGEKLVFVSFRKKVTWFGLTADEAEQLGTFLLKKAHEIRQG